MSNTGGGQLILKYLRPVHRHALTFLAKCSLQGYTLSSFCVTIIKMLKSANKILMLKCNPPRLPPMLSVKPRIHSLFKKQTVNLIYSSNIYLVKTFFMLIYLDPGEVLVRNG